MLKGYWYATYKVSIPLVNTAKAVGPPMPAIDESKHNRKRNSEIPFDQLLSNGLLFPGNGEANYPWFHQTFELTVEITKKPDHIALLRVVPPW